jgi:hypothetical protein
VSTIDLDSGKVNAQFIAGKQVHDIVLLDPIALLYEQSLAKR